MRFQIMQIRIKEQSGQAEQCLPSDTDSFTSVQQCPSLNKRDKDSFLKIKKVQNFGVDRITANIFLIDNRTHELTIL